MKSPDGHENLGAGRPKRGHILAQGVVRFLLVALSSELPQVPADYLVTVGQRYQSDLLQ